MSDEELERFADDEGHPVAKVGLRTLRAERAPVRAVNKTLVALRQGGGSGRSTDAAKDRSTFVVWAIVGAAVAAALVYFLFFR